MQSLGAECLSQFSVHISPRTHFRDRPVGEAAVIHREAVVMLKNWNNVLGSGLFEQARPGCWIEVLRPKHGDEILVPELSERTESAEVVLVFVRFRPVHIARIPFA